MSTHPDPEQLSAYVDGELTGTIRDDLEQHLTGCSDCSATVRALRATLADLRALPAPVPSEQESWALRAAIAKARKGPAERYRRLVIAAGGIAAVAAAIAVGVTFSSSPHKAMTSDSEARAPQAAAVAPAPIEIASTNYTSRSARSLLASAVNAAAGFSAVAPTPAGSTLGGTLDHQVSDAERTRYEPQIARCERDVLSSGSASPRPLEYVIAKYEGTPAFFMLYSVVVGGKTKTEMWVVRESDCYIRLFLAPQ